MLSRTPAAGMQRVIEDLERRYGSVAGYLAAAGLTAEQLDALRARLR
jgi:hypothetical protein